MTRTTPSLRDGADSHMTKCTPALMPEAQFEVYLRLKLRNLQVPPKFRQECVKSMRVTNNGSNNLVTALSYIYYKIP